MRGQGRCLKPLRVKGWVVTELTIRREVGCSKHLWKENGTFQDLKKKFICGEQGHDWKEVSQERWIKQILQGLLFHIKEFRLYIGKSIGEGHWRLLIDFLFRKHKHPSHYTQKRLEKLFTLEAVKVSEGSFCNNPDSKWLIAKGSSN